MEPALKDSFLICAFPRSRTMWLAHFLSVSGVSVCTHEATEFAGSAAEFWQNAEGTAESFGVSIYGNSDSANIFVLPALLADQPLTRVVWIARPIVEVAKSMKAANMPFTEQSARTLMAMRDRYKEYFDVVIEFSDLERMDVCKDLWEFVLPGVSFDFDRWGIFHSKKIAYTKDNPYPPKAYGKLLAWIEREINRPDYAK
jgi:hypothetical protein